MVGAAGLSIGDAEASSLRPPPPVLRYVGPRAPAGPGAWVWASVADLWPREASVPGALVLASLPA